MDEFRRVLRSGRLIGWTHIPTGQFLPLVAGGDGSDDDDKDKDKKKDDDKNKDADKDKDDELDKDKTSFTREEMEDILKSRLNRERKKFSDYDDLKEKAKKFDDAEKEKLDDLDRERLARQEAEEAAEKKVTKANKRAIVATAALEAAALGVHPKKIKFAIKCADLDDVEVDDDGEVDSDAVTKALEAVLKDMPELKAEGGSKPKPSADGGARRTEGDTPDTKGRLDKIKAETGIGARSTD